MSASIRVLRRGSNETYTGKTVASIVRRIYGRKAYVRWSPDPNNPYEGTIVEPVPGQRDVSNVLTQLVDHEGPTGEVDPADDLGELR